MRFLHKAIDRCECGHPLDVHWDRDAGMFWCSAPGCTCRRAGRRQQRLGPVLMSEEPAEMVRGWSNRESSPTADLAEIALDFRVVGNATQKLS